MKAEFISSAARYSQLPAPDGEEFCLLGRSNVGKSSFVNHVFENRKLARVSNTPGKTILANYYKVSDNSVWVDLPGYGFAKGPKTEKAGWSRLIEEYCEKRPDLIGGLWLLDIRHAGLEIDRIALQWFIARHIPILPILTKCDKIVTSKIKDRKKEFVEEFGLKEEPVVYSINSIVYREEFWKRFEKWRISLGPVAK